MKYMETYCETRIPHRLMWNNEVDVTNDINRYIGFANVSHSIWWYREKEQKYTKDGIPSRIGPVYESAIIDRLFFDIDIIDKDGNVDYDEYEKYKRIVEFIIRGNFISSISYTGGGFQILIRCREFPAHNYTGAFLYMCEKQIGISYKEIIDLARLKRVVGSFNFGRDGKSERNCFCISLKEEEWLLNPMGIRTLAQIQRKKTYWVGTEIYHIKGIKEFADKIQLDKRTEFSVSSNVDQILHKYGFDYTDLCPSIRSMIEQPHVHHFERLEIIKYLRTICGILYGDMVILLPKLLSAKHGITTDGGHSVIEKQPDSIYARNMWFNPYPLKQKGYCDPNCHKCSDYIKELFKNV